MTIEQAIKHAEEVAKEHERHLKIYENIDEDRPLFKEEENECKKCAEEHRQLAEWLRDYKRLLEQKPIDKLAMMYEIYMVGVNMSGEYNGCWVRFKDIEYIVGRYIKESEI